MSSGPVSKYMFCLIRMCLNRHKRGYRNIHLIKQTTQFILRRIWYKCKVLNQFCFTQTQKCRPQQPFNQAYSIHTSQSWALMANFQPSYTLTDAHTPRYQQIIFGKRKWPNILLSAEYCSIYDQTVSLMSHIIKYLKPIVFNHNNE